MNNLIVPQTYTRIIVLFLVTGLLLPSKNIMLVKSDNEDSISDMIFNADFDQRIEQLMLQGHIPSIAASVVYKDEIVWVKGYGNQSNIDTVYKLYSISKTFTSTAILQLYEQETIDLDDDVNDYLPFEFRNPNYPNTSITFRHLLSHRSSLSYSDTYSLNLRDLNPPFPENLEEYTTPSGSLYSSNIWMDVEPGERTQYSNLGFDLLAYLVELITQQPFEQYVSDYILTPLEMINTQYNISDYNSTQLAYGSSYNFNSEENELYDHFNVNGLGSAALQTTVTDLSHFMIAHMNEGEWNSIQILNDTTVELMHTDQGNGFGLGWLTPYSALGYPSLEGHTGGGWGFHSYMFINSIESIGVILFVNQDFRYLYELEDILDIAGKETAIFATVLQAGYQMEEKISSQSSSTSSDDGLVWLVISALGLGVTILVFGLVFLRKMMKG
ncbi:MAG: serine hydrolase domain-containing protein [Promethearchaeota archaeon]